MARLALTALIWLVSAPLGAGWRPMPVRALPQIEKARESVTVTASWYGPGFFGKTTASGEVFLPHLPTCAHKELPFGTRVRLTNPENNRSLVLRVNDRGPFIPGRDIDLNEFPAWILGYHKKGVHKLQLEVLE